jgi:hypothetical protein
MEPVSGFMSFDGKFFPSEEGCRAYEDKLAYLTELADRCQTVVKECKSGAIFSEKAHNSSPIPQSLRDYIRTIPVDDFTDLWNGHLMPLFVDSEGPVYERSFSNVLYEIPQHEGAREATDPWDFFVLKVETAYRLLAFVLGKPF